MRRRGSLLTLSAVLCLAAVAAVALVGWTPMPIPTSAGAEGAPDHGRPLVGQVAALHAVPHLAGGGFVETYYSDRLSLDDQEYVRGGMLVLAERAGIAPAMPEVFAALDELQRELPQGSYPFSYPRLEAALEPVLVEDVLGARRAELHELASLAILAASRRGTNLSEPGAWDGALAYVLLRALARDPDDCSAHLDLAVLVALGQLPSADSIDETFSAAVLACPGDPTARWWWVQIQAQQAQMGFELELTGVQRAEAMARPLRSARAWQREQPTSALAWASEAEALVAQADSLSSLGVMPFTARARARMALERFRTADSLEHDPAFMVGQARALRVLGKHDEAADTMAEAMDEAPGNLDFHMLNVEMLEAARRFDDAAVEAEHSDFEQPRLTDLVSAAGSPALVGLGLTGRTPVSVGDPTYEELGAGAVDWLGFIPDYRRQGPAASTSAWCVHRTRLRNLVLAGRPEDALAAWHTDVSGCDFGRGGSDYDPSTLESFDDVDARLLRALAWEKLGDPAARDAELAAGPEEYDDVALATFYDNAQNLWRSVGDLDHAERSAREWVAVTESPLAHLRLGEILFLRGDPDAAAEEMFVAVRAPTVRESESGWTRTAAAEATLAYGAALEKAGLTDEARSAYRVLASVTDVPGEKYSPNYSFRLSIAGAQARLGLLALEDVDHEGAVRWLRPSAEYVRNFENPPNRTFDPFVDSYSGGAEANNLAVALLGQDDLAEEEAAEALGWAGLAVAHDYESPIYRDTLALAYQENGDEDGAVGSYRTALAGDPTLYQSWNNLGVLLDEQGDRRGAVSAFRSAVGARPDYALGWFNLGVVLGRGRSPVDFVASQRALARAVRLDPSFRGRSDTVEKDRSVVLTGLDVSRPVPADWRFVDTATEAAPGLSVVVLLLAVWRLLVALGLDQLGGWAGGRLLRGDTHRRWGRAWARLDRFTALAWAFAASLVVVSWPLARGAAGQWWQLAAVAAALLASLWLFVTVTRWQAGLHPGPPDSRPVYRGWAPGMAFGVASSLAGYAFVPVPVNAQPFTDHRVRRAGLLVLAGVAGGMLALGLVTGAPVARLVGIGALAMLSTALFPLKPYDGGYLRHRGAAVASSLALVGVSSALVLGWL